MFWCTASIDRPGCPRVLYGLWCDMNSDNNIILILLKNKTSFRSSVCHSSSRVLHNSLTIQRKEFPSEPNIGTVVWERVDENDGPVFYRKPYAIKGHLVCLCACVNTCLMMAVVNILLLHCFFYTSSIVTISHILNITSFHNPPRTVVSRLALYFPAWIMFQVRPWYRL